MKALKLILTFILALTLFTSCSGKKTKGTSKFTVNISALTASKPLNGGMLFVGHRVDEKATFSMALFPESPDPVIELDNGVWEFFVASWDGSRTPKSGNLIGGNNYCAYHPPIELKGGENSISFEMHTDHCFDPFGASGEVASSDQNGVYGVSFPTLTIHSCFQSDDGNFSIASNCAAKGITKSARVSVTTEQKGSTFFPNNSIVGECQDGFNGAGVKTTPFTVPTGDIGQDGSVFQTYIELFASDDCSGKPVVYNLRGLITDPMAGDVNIGTNYIPNSGESILKVTHNPETPVQQGFDPMLAYFGTGKDQTTIISPVYAKVNELSLDGKTITAASAGQAGNFAIGDEVVLYINESIGDCGDYTPGEYSFQRISGVSGTAITLYNSINLPGKSLPAGNLTSSCSVQIAKVLNFSTIDTTSAGGDVNISTTAHNAGIGGIIIVRVQNEIIVDGTNNLVIDASNAGFLLGAGSTPNYGACSAEKCLKFGYGDSGNNGGGIVMLLANHINIKNGNIILNASTATSGNKGGDAILMANSIVVDGPGKLTAAEINADNSYGDGYAGRSILKFCDGVDNTGASKLAFSSEVDDGANYSSELSVGNYIPGLCN